MKTSSKFYVELISISVSLMFGVSLASSFLTNVAYEMDYTKGTLTSLVVSAWLIGKALIDVPSGIIATKIGRRKIIILGSILSMGGAILCASSYNIYM